jgi:hypothetical protein
MQLDPEFKKRYLKKVAERLQRYLQETSNETTEGGNASRGRGASRSHESAISASELYRTGTEGSLKTGAARWGGPATSVIRKLKDFGLTPYELLDPNDKIVGYFGHNRAGASISVLYYGRNEWITWLLEDLPRKDSGYSLQACDKSASPLKTRGIQTTYSRTARKRIIEAESKYESQAQEKEGRAGSRSESHTGPDGGRIHEYTSTDIDGRAQRRRTATPELTSRTGATKLSFIKKIPGHKNSEGEEAPWCILKHETGKILRSYKTKAEAKNGLKLMHIFSSRKTLLTLPIDDANAIEAWYDDEHGLGRA